MSTTLDFFPHTILPPRTLSSFIASHPSYTPSISTSSSTTLTNNEPAETTYPNTKPDQALKMHTRRNNQLVETRTTKPTLMTRLKGRNANSRTVKTTTTIEPRSAAVAHGHNTRTTRRSGWGRNTRANEPVVHHKRHATMGDKVSGAMMKLKGSLTRRPGLKVSYPVTFRNRTSTNYS